MDRAAVVEGSMARCTARIEAHARRAEKAQRHANILLLTGATLAALGSALAGFLSKESLRKATAVIGAIGAVLSVAPKAMDQPDDIKQVHRNASAHAHAALKIYWQLGFVSDRATKAELQAYIIRRFLDCEKDDPPEHVPDVASLPGIVLVDPPTVGKLKAIAQPAVPPTTPALTNAGQP
ncbi:hypothetical protein JGU66_07540 [Myxococcaceae bacterium JPH2]|nr:hypothetical protein [Myxococcaceae bacterium JPH2]